MDNFNAFERVVEHLASHGVDSKFVGVDLSLVESLETYGLIYSRELDLVIYTNEYGNLDIAKMDYQSLLEGYTEPFLEGGWANDHLDGFLSFNGYDTFDETTQDIVSLMYDFHSYYGVENSLLASNHYDRGCDINNHDEVQAFCTNIFNLI